MAQNPPRLCPRCGTPAEPNQRFCSECGTTLNVASNQPTALASGEQPALSSQGSGAQFAAQPEPGVGISGNSATAPTQLVGTPGQLPGTPTPPYSNAPISGAQFYSQTTDASPIAPPPPPDSLVSLPYQSLYQQAPAKTPPAQPTPAPGRYSVPDYARAPRRSRLGLIVGLVLLLMLVLGGVAAYALFFNKPNNKQGGTNPQHTATTGANTPGSTNVTATTGTGNSTPGSGNPTPTTITSTIANGATTEQVKLTFTYAGIGITVTTVQYAASFPDDSSMSGAGVRVAFTENNATNGNPNFLYGDVARLILPDHSLIAPMNEANAISADAQTNRSNWLDFQVASQPANLSQLILQMGTATENQMQIPLSPGADLSKYQPKTIAPGTTFHYAGLNWTLKSATESLSAADKQATSGNVYITVTVSVFNPQANDFSAYYGDYVRLSVGGTTNAPTGDTNFPTTFTSQTSTTGTLIFLVPEGSTTYTLVLLAISNPPAQQATVPFTIQ
jgi:zinc-ribbon domain